MIGKTVAIPLDIDSKAETIKAVEFRQIYKAVRMQDMQTDVPHNASPFLTIPHYLKSFLQLVKK